MEVRTPPALPCDTLAYTELPAGTTLWRVHRTHRSAAEFCPVPSDDLFGGGRFDSTSKDLYPFMYAAFTPETALCETLLHGLRFRGRTRQLLRREVKGRSLSNLTTTTGLTLLSLATSTDLARICQPDDWLLRADGHEYAQTRAWARWLREHASSVHGLIWQSRHNLPERSLILFGDRCPAGALVPDVSERPVKLDDAPGAAYLNRRLSPYAVTVSPPRG